MRGGKGGVVRKGGLRRGVMCGLRCGGVWLGLEGWAVLGKLVLLLLSWSRERARSGSIVVW